ncbi:MAG: ABC transporter ATP-binding protein [Mycoplasmataceae bacterium]|nr:ABC transporter ATP-binding protein [Mycoplasmataceae bacterium]
MTKKKILSVDNLTKTFGMKIVLKGISFDIYENEFVSILGPSGCGKTTTLKIIAGFDDPTSGTIKYLGKDLVNIPVFKRPFHTVFQSYALFPNMNVYDNIAYGLRVSKKERDYIDKEIRRVSEVLNIKNELMQDISTLSGGQKQRVALARALVMKPKILLLDEPLGALDSRIKSSTKDELKRLQREFGITFIYITHDQEEALTMSDQVIIMNDGKIEQIGKPIEIYDEPENKWIAKFVGDANLITEGKMVKDGIANFFGKDFKTTSKGFGENENVDIMIRPEDIEETTKNPMLIATVSELNFAGVFWENWIEFEFNNKTERLLMHTTKQYKIGDKVGVKWDDDAIHVMWKDDREYAKEI